MGALTGLKTKLVGVDVGVDDVGDDGEGETLEKAREWR